MYSPFDAMDWNPQRRVCGHAASLRHVGRHECDHGHHDPLPPHQVRRATTDEAGAQGPSLVRQHVLVHMNGLILRSIAFGLGGM